MLNRILKAIENSTILENMEESIITGSYLKPFKEDLKVIKDKAGELGEKATKIVEMPMIVNVKDKIVDMKNELVKVLPQKKD